MVDKYENTDLMVLCDDLIALTDSYAKYGIVKQYTNTYSQQPKMVLYPDFFLSQQTSNLHVCAMKPEYEMNTVRQVIGRLVCKFGDTSFVTAFNHKLHLQSPSHEMCSIDRLGSNTQASHIPRTSSALVCDENMVKIWDIRDRKQTFVNNVSRCDAIQALDEHFFAITQGSCFHIFDIRFGLHNVATLFMPCYLGTYYTTYLVKQPYDHIALLRSSMHSGTHIELFDINQNKIVYKHTMMPQGMYERENMVLLPDDSLAILCSDTIEIGNLMKRNYNKFFITQKEICGSQQDHKTNIFQTPNGFMVKRGTEFLFCE